MEAKEILTPKNMLVTLGTIVIVMSFYGMSNGDEWAEVGWGEENDYKKFHKSFYIFINLLDCIVILCFYGYFLCVVYYLSLIHI